jgi:Homeodomain-like domain
VIVVLTQAQRDDAVRLVQDGYSTAAVARLMGCSRRRIQELVLIAEESSEAEIGEARDAYRALVAQRGERLPATDEDKSSLLDEIFGTDEELSAIADELFGFDPID